MLVVCIVILSACSSTAELEAGETNQDRTPSAAPAYKSPYDAESLVQRDGRFEYQQDGQVVSRAGIDVSSHQGVIDWDAVARDNIDFAFIRIGNRGYTEGKIFLDEYFEDNLEGARAAQLPVGVYIFSQGGGA